MAILLSSGEIPPGVADNVPNAILSRLAWSETHPGCVILLTVPRGHSNPIEPDLRTIPVFRGISLRRLVKVAQMGRDIEFSETIRSKCRYTRCVRQDHLEASLENVPWDELLSASGIHWKRTEAIELLNQIRNPEYKRRGRPRKDGGQQKVPSEKDIIMQQVFKMQEEKSKYENAWGFSTASKPSVIPPLWPGGRAEYRTKCVEYLTLCAKLQAKLKVTPV